MPGTDHPYRCQLLAGLLKQSSLTHQCEVLFCPADNSKRYSCFDYLLPTWSVYPLWPSAACPWPRLPCVYSITCLPPASTLAFSLFTIQPFYDIPDAVTRSVPVWLVVHLIKLLMDPNATDSASQLPSEPFLTAAGSSCSRGTVCWLVWLVSSSSHPETTPNVTLTQAHVLFFTWCFSSSHFQKGNFICCSSLVQLLLNSQKWFCPRKWDN